MGFRPTNPGWQRFSINLSRLRISSNEGFAALLRTHDISQAPDKTPCSTMRIANLQDRGVFSHNWSSIFGAGWIHQCLPPLGFRLTNFLCHLAAYRSNAIVLILRWPGNFRATVKENFALSASLARTYAITSGRLTLRPFLSRNADLATANSLTWRKWRFRRGTPNSYY